MQCKGLLNIQENNTEEKTVTLDAFSVYFIDQYTSIYSMCMCLDIHTTQNAMCMVHTTNKARLSGLAEIFGPAQN